jgi:thiol:disulfide interchange protein
MTDEKKIKIAFGTLVLASAFEAIFLLTQLSEQFYNILWGLQLFLVLVTLGISAKMLGNFSAAKRQRTQSRFILIFAALLSVYAFII